MSNETHRRRKKKKVSPVKILIGCVVAIGIVFAMIKSLDGAITDMYNTGSSVPEEFQTAEEVSDDVVNILVCGLDWDEGRTGMMADVILYVSLDAKAGKINVLQIPRDTYVGAPSKTGKINGVYQAGKEEEKMLNMVNTINERFGLAVDHYVSLDMEAFIKIVDAVEGGLDMYVPCPIITKDPDTGKEVTVIEEAGWYKVNGQTAEAIVRNRNYGMADLQRLEVQRYFYASVIKYFKDAGITDTLKIMGRFTPYITTDMHWTRIASLAATTLNIDYANMVLIKPGLNGLMVDGQNVLEIPQQEWLDVINNNFRPYQTPVEALHIDEIEGNITSSFGQTAISVTNIGELLSSAQ